MSSCLLDSAFTLCSLTFDSTIYFPESWLIDHDNWHTMCSPTHVVKFIPRKLILEPKTPGRRDFKNKLQEHPSSSGFMIMLGGTISRSWIHTPHRHQLSLSMISRSPLFNLVMRLKRVAPPLRPNRKLATTISTLIYTSRRGMQQKPWGKGCDLYCGFTVTAKNKTMTIYVFKKG